MNTKHKFLFGAAAVALTSLGAVKAQAMSVQDWLKQQLSRK